MCAPRECESQVEATPRHRADWGRLARGSSLLCWLGLTLASGCSVLALRESDCESDAQCVSAFGAGSVCSAEGTCRPGMDGESSGGDGSTSATEGADETGCVSLCEVGLADACGDQLPVLESSAEFRRVSTVDLRNDFDELSCLSDPPLGNDGFFALDLTAGERWHFHLRVTDPATNPAMYVLPQCDERSCQSGDGMDLCAAGADEHLSFVATEAGRYVVGIDGREAGGAEYELLALRPTCGNGGMPEHSESCDDGNTAPMDGCDPACRAELRTATPEEIEPNDDRWGANVLLLDETTSSLTVEATVGGRCDFDNFAVRVEGGETLTARVTSASGDACEGSAPPITLRLSSADGNQLGEGRTMGGNPCPFFGVGDDFASGLAPGEYFIRVSTPQDEDAFDYALAVTLEPPV